MTTSTPLLLAVLLLAAMSLWVILAPKQFDDFLPLPRRALASPGLALVIRLCIAVVVVAAPSAVALLKFQGPRSHELALNALWLAQSQSADEYAATERRLRHVLSDPSARYERLSLAERENAVAALGDESRDRDNSVANFQNLVASARYEAGVEGYFRDRGDWARLARSIRPQTSVAFEDWGLSVDLGPFTTDAIGAITVRSPFGEVGKFDNVKVLESKTFTFREYQFTLTCAHIRPDGSTADLILFRSRPARVELATK